MKMLSYIHKKFISLLWREKPYYDILKEDNEYKEMLFSRLYSQIKVNVTEEDLHKYIEKHTLHRSPRSRSTVKIQCTFLENILKDPHQIQNVIEEIQGKRLIKRVYNVMVVPKRHKREEFVNVVHL